MPLDAENHVICTVVRERVGGMTNDGVINVAKYDATREKQQRGRVQPSQRRRASRRGKTSG